MATGGERSRIYFGGASGGFGQGSSDRASHSTPCAMAIGMPWGCGAAPPDSMTWLRE